MPWTIPNLLLHDKPVPLANMRSHGRNSVFVCCSNPACDHNAELDVSRLPDDVTFNDLHAAHRILQPLRADTASSGVPSGTLPS
jgi:hypothetical protein